MQRLPWSSGIAAMHCAACSEALRQDTLTPPRQGPQQSPVTHPPGSSLRSSVRSVVHAQPGLHPPPAAARPPPSHASSQSSSASCCSLASAASASVSSAAPACSCCCGAPACQCGACCNPAQHSFQSFDLACSLPASPRDPPAGGPLHWPSASHRMPNEPYWARDDGGTSRTTTGQTAPGELLRSPAAPRDLTVHIRYQELSWAQVGGRVSSGSASTASASLHPSERRACPGCLGALPKLGGLCQVGIGLGRSCMPPLTVDPDYCMALAEPEPEPEGRSRKQTSCCCRREPIGSLLGGQ